MGLFTLPQAMELWIPGVSTTNLSSGDLPVYFPVVTTNAPVSERVPSPLCKAFSIKSAGDKFDIYKTIRWIPFKKEKAENDYEKNFENFEKHLLKSYRYYIKHSIWEKFIFTIYTFNAFFKSFIKTCFHCSICCGNCLIFLQIYNCNECKLGRNGQLYTSIFER